MHKFKTFFDERYFVTSCQLVDFLEMEKEINLLCILRLMILNIRYEEFLFFSMLCHISEQREYQILISSLVS